MNKSMQMWNLNRMIADGSRHPTDTIDVRALLDTKLTLSENRKNIAKQIGITTRNYGLEQHTQREDERKRAKAQREDVLRQVGHSFYPEIDRARSAMRPGKRFSKGGHRYYERRVNRCDAAGGV
jgi:hypothetical protein